MGNGDDIGNDEHNGDYGIDWDDADEDDDYIDWRPGMRTYVRISVNRHEFKTSRNLHDIFGPSYSNRKQRQTL